MFISKKAISRRRLLQGAGAAMALPLLDSMIPAMAATVNPTLRFGAVYVPNGMVMQNWTPQTTGPDFEITPILQPLARFKDRLLVLSGLNSTLPADARPGSGTHSRAATRFLTDHHPGQPENWAAKQPISMDQVAARIIGQETPLSSLELGLEGANFAGSCDSGGFNCAFTYTISWRNSTTPLPMEHNPRAVFERLFGDNESTDSKIRSARIQDQRSILDSVSDDISRLQRSLGASDRIKVDSYLDAVRDVERRIAMIDDQGDTDVPYMERPLGVPSSFAEHAALMYDLQLLAYQTDRTRIITFMSGHELSGRTYPEIEVPDAHHPLSHHQNTSASLAKLTKINTYHVSFFAEFLAKLAATEDGDSSLLDQSMIIYGAGMSNSNTHSPYNLPILIAGGGAGTLKTGRHLQYPAATPLANLHLSLLDKLGAPIEKIGDSTGRLDLQPTTLADV